VRPPLRCADPLFEFVLLRLQCRFEFLRLIEQHLLILIRSNDDLVQLLILDLVEFYLCGREFPRAQESVKECVRGTVAQLLHATVQNDGHDGT
jgi:hypothetical protein